MYQSVLAKRQGTGSSGTGFAFVLVDIKEVHPDTNICLARDVDNNASYYQLGLNKRGETAWPQVGEQWIIDRSMGHWMLQCKVTDTQAPVFTGNFSAMDADLLRLVTIFQGMGLIQDGTTAGTVPSVTGSRAQISPAVQQIISILDAKGILNDATTAPTVAVDTWITPTLAAGWTPFAAGVAPRFKLNYDNTVTVEGRAVPPGTVTAGDLVFTIDAGFQPPVSKYFTTMVANSAVGNLIFGADRSVRIWDFGATTVTRLLMQCRYSLLP
jgi:uncharacterized membrane protein